jgi:hypothetical protein
MTWKYSKVVPMRIIRDKKQCCICYQNTFKFDKCSICKEGIVCSGCSKIMTDTKCPICRNIKFKPIEIITTQETQYVIIKNRSCKCNEPPQICLGSLLCFGIPFGIGILFCYLIYGNVSKMMKTTNPMIFFFTGIILILAITVICCVFIFLWKEFVLKKYKKNSNSN